jgi:thiol-disulfide isomerase/thioredoxin
VSVELGPICGESHFDQVMEDAQKLGESVVIVWMAAWCRKCIYLKPKLEKLAAEFYPRFSVIYILVFIECFAMDLDLDSEVHSNWNNYFFQTAVLSC